MASATASAPAPTSVVPIRARAQSDRNTKVATETADSIDASKPLFDPAFAVDDPHALFDPSNACVVSNESNAGVPPPHLAYITPPTRSNRIPRRHSLSTHEAAEFAPSSTLRFSPKSPSPNGASVSPSVGRDLTGKLPVSEVISMLSLSTTSERDSRALDPADNPQANRGSEYHTESEEEHGTFKLASVGDEVRPPPQLKHAAGDKRPSNSSSQGVAEPVKSSSQGVAEPVKSKPGSEHKAATRNSISHIEYPKAGASIRRPSASGVLCSRETKDSQPAHDPAKGRLLRRMHSTSCFELPKLADGNAHRGPNVDRVEVSRTELSLPRLSPSSQLTAVFSPPPPAPSVSGSASSQKGAGNSVPSSFMPRAERHDRQSAPSPGPAGGVKVVCGGGANARPPSPSLLARPVSDGEVESVRPASTTRRLESDPPPDANNGVGKQRARADDAGADRNARAQVKNKALPYQQQQEEDVEEFGGKESQPVESDADFLESRLEETRREVEEEQKRRLRVEAEIDKYREEANQLKTKLQQQVECEKRRDLELDKLQKLVDVKEQTASKYRESLFAIQLHVERQKEQFRAKSTANKDLESKLRGHDLVIGELCQQLDALNKEKADTQKRQINVKLEELQARINPAHTISSSSSMGPPAVGTVLVSTPAGLAQVPTRDAATPNLITDKRIPIPDAVPRASKGIGCCSGGNRTNGKPSKKQFILFSCGGR